MLDDLQNQFAEQIATDNSPYKKILKNSRAQNQEKITQHDSLTIDIKGLELGLNRLYSGADPSGINTIGDYCPNGIQVERIGMIRRVATAVTASLYVIEQAKKLNIDTLIVHHGIFWGQSSGLTGHLYQRVQTLINANIGLLAYHLPMDSHKLLGNSAQFALALDMTDTEPFAVHKGIALGIIGQLKEPENIVRLLQKIEDIVKRKPLLLGKNASDLSKGQNFDSLPQIGRIAIVSGSGQEEFFAAVKEGADVFITGEASEQYYHLAQEEGVYFIAAGHHATERFGPIALARFLEQSELFNQVIFIDEDNPV